MSESSVGKAACRRVFVFRPKSRDDRRRLSGAGLVCAAEVFVGLIEAIVDRIADVLEHIASELDILSHRLFRSRSVDGRAHRSRAQENATLRSILRRLGASGDLASKIRDSLLALGRIVPYVATTRGSELSGAVRTRLDTLRHDLASLNDYEAHLLNKVQLLMDATLGLINVEQNDIIKVLTVVSVVIAFLASLGPLTCPGMVSTVSLP